MVNYTTHSIYITSVHSALVVENNHTPWLLVPVDSTTLLFVTLISYNFGSTYWWVPCRVHHILILFMDQYFLDYWICHNPFLNFLTRTGHLIAYFEHFKYIFIYFFTYPYIENTQTTLLKLLYETPPTSPKKKKKLMTWMTNYR